MDFPRRFHATSKYQQDLDNMDIGCVQVRELRVV